jgi:hypothetical protein
VQYRLRNTGFEGYPQGRRPCGLSNVLWYFLEGSAKLSPRILVRFLEERATMAGELARRVVDLYKQVGFASDNYRASRLPRGVPAQERKRSVERGAEERGR